MNHSETAPDQTPPEDSQRWRRLYEAEAEQRRRETQALQAQVAALKSELTLRKSQIDPDPERVRRLQQQVARLQDPVKLQRLLVEAVTECERLRLALSQEQQAHRQTRDSLMNTLVDAMAELRNRSEAPDPQSKTPSPAPPPPSSAQPLDRNGLQRA
ncbi:hypothetical protein [Leptolyngbya sp. FACHB-261]|uniref:hypothetical protein n=1 Tax=Leptolyngbya sp. FACHB-261 TaxID=2692806 RepID=UPI001689DF97|nr:hypothetical protein [Leptolyngbya sp. FACHB-261]MBD2100482.1 hypothetical protein [Leptolyngbya sp. FACHB-261]